LEAPPFICTERQLVVNAGMIMNCRLGSSGSPSFLIQTPQRQTLWRLNFATAKSSDLQFSILQIQRLNSWGRAHLLDMVLVPSSAVSEHEWWERDWPQNLIFVSWNWAGKLMGLLVMKHSRLHRIALGTALSLDVDASMEIVRDRSKNKILKN
jgi:hypothetical protein